MGEFPKNFPRAYRSCYGTDTDHLMKPNAETSVEKPHPTPTNRAAQKMTYVIIQNQTATTITDIETCPTTIYEKHTYTFRKSHERVMELICEKSALSAKRLANFLKQLIKTTD